MFDIEDVKEKVILVGVSLSDDNECMESLDELEELAKTAGAVCVAKVYQNREQIHPGTYVGKGKIEELKDLIWETEATGIICDDEGAIAWNDPSLNIDWRIPADKVILSEKDMHHPLLKDSEFLFNIDDELY